MSLRTLIRCAFFGSVAAIAALVAPAVPAAELNTKVAQTAATQCLTPAQRRTVAASGKVVPLAKAIRAARARKVDVVDAKLCKGPKGLVYLLTLLAQDGKVTRATVDATSGQLTDGG